MLGPAQAARAALVARLQTLTAGRGALAGLRMQRGHELCGGRTGAAPADSRARARAGLLRVPVHQPRVHLPDDLALPARPAPGRAHSPPGSALPALQDCLVTWPLRHAGLKGALQRGCHANGIVQTAQGALQDRVPAGLQGLGCQWERCALLAGAGGAAPRRWLQSDARAPRPGTTS